MDASMAVWRAIRAFQKSARGWCVETGQSVGASRGTSHSTRAEADTTSPLGIMNAASAGASNLTSLPSRPPAATRNGVACPWSAAFSRSSSACTFG
jgi:hypothetical protein